MEIIKHKSQIIAIIYRDDVWTKGLNFITPDNLFVQVGSWWYNEGKKLDSHVHNDFKREAMRTQEMTYVKKGSMRVLLYTDEKKYLQDFVLYQGDLAVFAYGGHGFDILEDNTKILEVKNGPFVDVETDKTKF